MERSFNLLERFPDRWRLLKEVQAIADSDLTELEDEDNIHTIPHLWSCMDTELNNVFIIPYGERPGADEYACSRWEAILGIVPANDMTLDDRQFNIYTKLYQSTPYSYKAIQRMLDDLVGKGEYSLTRNVEAQTIEVKMSIASRFKADSVKELLDRIVPASMIINTTVAYTTHDTISKYTHDELSVYTHDEIKITEL